MIEAYIYRNKDGNIYGYKITDHAVSSVCNAVSILVLNTLNSIEQFSSVLFDCDYNEDGGFFWLNIEQLKDGEDHDAQLLLKSLFLGLKGIEAEYGNEIKVKEVYSDGKNKS